MSKRQVSLNSVFRIVLLILMAFFVLGEPVLFLIFFVPIVGWYVWRLNDRTKELERKLADKDKPHD